MIEYIVGIDFGHGETAAWCVPVKDDNPANLKKEGMALMLRMSNNPDEKKIPSVVFHDGKGNYSLTPTLASGVESEMKGRIAGMSEERKLHYSNYIRVVVERLLEYNGDILKIDGEPNFALCIASPTRWTDDEKREYLQFFNEAIASLNLEFEWIINESDAAYFAHSDIVKSEECVLVIDYGSSTIDYTVMRGGKKISDDSWSNQQLGASIIENAMLDTIMVPEGQSFNRMLETTSDLLQQHQLARINPLHYLRHWLRMEKERDFSNSTYDFDPIYKFKKVTGYSVFDQPVYAFEGNLLEITTDYRKAVEKDLEALREKIRSVHNGKDPDRVILSGGASIMKWFRDMSREVFNTDQIMDFDPAYVVAKGIALYARAQLVALKKFMDYLAAINYGTIYTDSDVQATKEGTESFVSTPINKILSEVPVTGNRMRDIFCDFIHHLDSSNEAYRNLLQKSFDKNISTKVKNALSSAIMDVFKANIKLDDVEVHIPVDVIDWNPKVFEKGGAWYEWFGNAIDSSSSRWSFTWDLARDKSETNVIVNGVKKRLGKMDMKTFIIYPKEVIDKYGQVLKEQTMLLGFDVFYKNQLFKTTFVERPV